MRGTGLEEFPTCFLAYASLNIGARPNMASMPRLGDRLVRSIGPLSLLD